MSKAFAIPALSFPVETDIILPGSKSHANRAIVCACLASGRTLIRNATPCDDVLVMVENLQKMGFDIRWINKQTGELKVTGGIPTPTSSPSPEGRGEGTVLDCHNAGTALRFLLSVAALVPGGWILTGDMHMQKRPIGDLSDALRSLGTAIEDSGGCPPITVRGGMLQGSVVRLKASVSSQYLTSLLLIAPLLPNGLTIELDGPLASESYIDLTEKVMKDFGVTVERTAKGFIVRKGLYVAYSPHSAPSNRAPLSSVPERGRSVIRENVGSPFSRALEKGTGDESYEIEGDWSAAGAWLVLNELTKSRIRCTNLRTDSLQADRKLPQTIVALRKRGNLTIDCSAIPDQVMNLALLAAFRQGRTTIIGAANLRKKECDRLAVITSELQKVGIKITDNKDGLIIDGNPIVPHPSSLTLEPHHDHRMAMSFAILGLLRDGVSIENPDCTVKSYPDFFAHLTSILASSRPIAIVGMRGAGKSGLARRLASRLKLQCIDVDKLFEAKHGPIKTYIAVSGWPAFRSLEEKLVSESLKTGAIVSLGGGATESKKTRMLLKERAVVIWIQATKTELIQRLESGKRPPITGLPLHEEVHKLLVERAPNYKEVAHIMIPPKLSYPKQIPFAVKALRELVKPHSV